MENNNPSENINVQPEFNDKPVVKTKEYKEVKAIAHINNEIEKILSQTINLNNENEIHEPTCPICSSALRSELEKIYDVNRKDQEIVDFFNARSNIKISRDLVKNHMMNHSGRAMKELQKLEYLGRIQRLKSQNTTTLGKLDTYEAILYERILGINSLSPGSAEISSIEVEKVKTDQTAKIVAQLQNIAKLRATIMGEMKNSGEVITLPTKEFVKIFTDAVTTVQNDREKALIMGILDKLKLIGH